MKVTETDFASQVEYLLNLYSWHWIHIRPARIIKNGQESYRTPVSGHGKGFLDYLALRPPRVLVCELKDDYGKLTPEQQEWFDLWQSCSQSIILNPVTVNRNGLLRLDSNIKTMTIPEVYIWRPKDFEEIANILR